MRFISEYIPQLGFTVTFEFIHQAQGKNFYYIVESLVPPGRLYGGKKKLGLEDTHAATDVQVVHKIDFESPVKAIRFTDNQKEYYMTKPDVTAVIIFEIFSVTVKNDKIDKVANYGFSILPLFQYVELDGSQESIEVFVNSSIRQLPIFKGVPDRDLIDKVVQKPNVAVFIASNIENKSLEVIPKTSLIVMLKDNQFEEFCKDKMRTMNEIDTQFMTMKNAKTYAFNYKKDYVSNKSSLLKKMLPKKMSPANYESQVYDYINTNLNLD
jgi:hypothetical protein